MRRLIPMLLCLTLATPAGAAQPLSASLVDCAAIFTMANRAGPGREMTENRAALYRMGVRFAVAAAARAVDEGHDQPAAYVATLWPKKTAHWDRRGPGFFFSANFRDWTRYCVALSRHLDIRLRD